MPPVQPPYAPPYQIAPPLAAIQAIPTPPATSTESKKGGGFSLFQMFNDPNTFMCKIKEDNSLSIMAIIILLLLVFLIANSCSKNKDKKITRSDVKMLRDNMAEN